MIAAATGTAVPAALTLQSLPLFPLSAVLFPEGLLSLRVLEVRYLDIYEGKFDEAQFTDWVKQASRLPGERM